MSDFLGQGGTGDLDQKGPIIAPRGISNFGLPSRGTIGSSKKKEKRGFFP